MHTTFSKTQTALALFCCLILVYGCTGLSGIDLSDDAGNQPGQSGLLSPARLNAMIEQGRNLLLVDIRAPEEYSRGHLPAAISMPMCNREGHSAQLPEDKDQDVVVYCGWQGCGGLSEAARLLRDAGFSPVRTLDGGVEAWNRAGYPLVADDRLVAKGQRLLIDLRPAHKDTVMRIPGSLSIPFAVFARQMHRLPSNGLLILYSDSAQETRQALTLCRQAGLTAVMVEGNLQGWKKRGGRLDSGPVNTSFQWTQTLPAGSVNADTLLAVTRDGARGKALLDVRTDRESARGRIKGALHIPLNQLAARMSELSTETTYIVYSSHGSRAELAMHLLREQGIRARYFAGTVRCQDGRCQLLD